MVIIALSRTTPRCNLKGRHNVNITPSDTCQECYDIQLCNQLSQYTIIDLTFIVFS